MKENDELEENSKVMEYKPINMRIHSKMNSDANSHEIEIRCEFTWN